MLFRVAALLGRTVEELQQTMTADEFIEWCAFYQIEPWGFEMANWRAALVSMTVANFSGRVKKPLKIGDFLPGAKRKRKLTPAELAARLESDIRKANNG